MKTRVLLFDLNNLIYTCFFNSVTASGLKPDNVPANFKEYLVAFHSRVAGLSANNPGASLVFALDSFPKWKKELFPGYKAGRKPMEFNPKPGCLELVRSWTCSTIEAEATEADDLIATFVARYWDTYDIVVVSTDKDLWQILDHPDVRMFNFHSNLFVNSEMLKEHFELEQYAQIKLYKTLWGDSSDNIPNVVPRMQKHLLPLIRETDGSLEKFEEVYKSKKETLSKRCQELVDTNWEQIGTNYKLVNLSYTCPIIFRNWPQTQMVNQPL